MINIFFSFLITFLFTTPSGPVTDVYADAMCSEYETSIDGFDVTFVMDNTSGANSTVDGHPVGCLRVSNAAADDELYTITWTLGPKAQAHELGHNLGAVLPRDNVLEFYPESHVELWAVWVTGGDRVLVYIEG